MSVLDLVGLVYADHDDLVLGLRLLPVDERARDVVALVGLYRLDDQDIAGGVEHPGDDLEDDGVVRDVMRDLDLVVVDVEVIVHIINVPKLLHLTLVLPID